MSDYQLEIKQIVDYSRCRVYRQFIQSLISDRSIQTNNGCSGFFIMPYFAPMSISEPLTAGSMGSPAPRTLASRSVLCTSCPSGYGLEQSDTP